MNGNWTNTKFYLNFIIKFKWIHKKMNYLIFFKFVGKRPLMPPNHFISTYIIIIFPSLNCLISVFGFTWNVIFGMEMKTFLTFWKSYDVALSGRCWKGCNAATATVAWMAPPMKVDSSGTSCRNRPSSLHLILLYILKR